MISIDITLDNLQNEGEDKYRIYYTYHFNLFKNGKKLNLDSEFSTCELEIELEIEMEIKCQNVKFSSTMEIDRDFENGFGSHNFLVQGKTKVKNIDGQDFEGLKSLGCNEIELNIEEIEIEFDNCKYKSDKCEIEIEDEKVTLKAIESPLPIELITFDAIKKDRQVELLWKTATETNNDYFTIERSKDGKSWEDIQTIIGAGNSVKAINYSWTDKSPYTGLSYYRLRQTDFDGSTKSFNIISVTQEEVVSLKAYPNPVVNTVTLLGVDSEQNIRIFNAVGVEVTNSVSISNTNSNKAFVNMSDLPKGVYYISNGEKPIQVIKQ